MGLSPSPSFMDTPTKMVIPIPLLWRGARQGGVVEPHLEQAAEESSGFDKPFPHSGNDHPSSILARAKQGRADAHDGRALGDGRLHILAGAHG